MKIEVTQEHIDKGRQYSPYKCPIALAVQTAVNCGFISVSPMGITVGKTAKPATPERLPTPTKVRKFISAFDKGKPVKPFSFELPLETK